MNNDMQGIMRKLANMKKLAERPGTPEEAAAALAAIQKLMTKWSITEAELIAAGEIEAGATIHEEMTVGSNLQWRKVVMQALAHANNCAIVFAASGPGCHVFGKEHNVAVTTGMFEYLVQAINRLANDGWQDSSARQIDPSAKRTWKHSFRVGAGTTIAKRIRLQAAEARHDAGKANALMVADKSEADLMMKEMFGRTRSSRTNMQHRSAEGARSGAAAGGKVSLHGQVHGGTTRSHKALVG